MSDFALLIKAGLQMYRECVRDATLAFFRNWPLIVGSFGLYLVFVLAYGPISMLGMAGGFILGLLSALLTAQYYSWLQSAAHKERIRIEDLYRPDWGMFLNVISVSFVLYIVYFLSSSLGSTEQTRPVLYLVYFLIVFAFNPLPEVVYIRRAESVNAFSDALVFMKENWIEWYLPYIILLLPLILTYDPASLLLRFALLYPLYPGLLIMQAWSGILDAPYLGTLLSFCLAHWFMLFRGFLFKDLESGSRRARIYRAKQK